MRYRALLRDSRSVVLTADGADLLAAAQETLAAAARLTVRVDRLDPDLPRGTSGPLPG